MIRRKRDRNEDWPVPVAERVHAPRDARKPRRRKRDQPPEPEDLTRSEEAMQNEEPDRWLEEPAAEFATQKRGHTAAVELGQIGEEEPPSPEETDPLAEYTPPAGPAPNGDLASPPEAGPGAPERGGSEDDLRETVHWLVTSVRSLLDERSEDGTGTAEPSVSEPLVLSLEPSRALISEVPQPMERVRLEAATAEVDGEEVTAEVTLVLNGEPSIGSGRGHEGRDGTLLAAARACVDALTPILSGGVQIEGIYTARASLGRELLMVSLVVGEELLVGSGRILEGQEALSASRAVLDALNRRLSRPAAEAT